MAGFWEDIGGFLMEEFQNTGKQAASMTNIMDKWSKGEATPEERKSVVSEGINNMGALPLAIKSSAWAGLTPEIKTNITEMANQNPDLMKQVLEDPRYLTARPLAPGGNVMGRMKGGKMELDPGLGEQFGKDTVTHELTHFTQNPRVAKTDPADAATMGYLLNDILPQDYTQSLQNVLDIRQRYGGGPGAVRVPLKSAPVTSELFKRNLANQDTAKFSDVFNEPVVSRNYGKQVMTRGDQVNRLAMDEGLAYLSELANMSNATTEMKKLASLLGLKVGK